MARPVAVRLAMAGVLPSPLKLPPVRVTEAPLKLAVGSDLTVTAPIARPAVRISAPITAALMPNFRAMGTTPSTGESRLA